MFVFSLTVKAEEYFVTPLAHLALDKAGCSCKSVRDQKFIGYAVCHLHEDDIKKDNESGLLKVECKKYTVKIHPSHMVLKPH